jgi:hypothetical protein
MCKKQKTVMISEKGDLIMKRLMISIISAAIPFWTLGGVYGQDSNQPAKPSTSTASNQYHCSKHPEITASWSARCPKCGANLVRRQRTNHMGSDRKKGEETRHKIMMNTAIDVFDPEAVLSAKKPLALNKEQIEQLKAISMTARQCAREVLNDKQLKKLNTLKKLPDFPKTMAQMHQRMMQKMSSSKAMNMSGMMKQKKTQDPPSDKKMNSENHDMNRRMSQNELSNDFEDKLRDQFRDHLRDRLRDHYRDKFRDQQRDRFRDHFRDRYRDHFRDRSRDEHGDIFSNPFGGDMFNNPFGGEMFNSPYSFGPQGFGNESFGRNEFGNERFGNEDFRGRERSGGDERRR